MTGVRAIRAARPVYDGEPVTETVVMQLLVEAGFLAGPRRAAGLHLGHGGCRHLRRLCAKRHQV